MSNPGEWPLRIGSGGPLNVESSPPDGEQVDSPGNFLSATELEALELTGALANKVSHIVKDGGNPEAGKHDWREAAALIHQIQHLIMSQAAARAYPDQFRLLGSSMRDRTPSTR